MQGSLTMLAFGIGTLPVMLPLTSSGARLGQALQRAGWRMAAGARGDAGRTATLAAPWLQQVPGVHQCAGRNGLRQPFLRTPAWRTPA